MKKHILILTSEFPPQPGGIGTHAYHLALALNNQGYTVTVVTDQRSEDGHAETMFDARLPFTVQRIKKRSPRIGMYINRFYTVYKALNGVEKVIASGKFSLWVVAWCAFFRKRFTLAVVHGTEVNLTSKVYRKLVEMALKRFDKIVAVSNYTKNLIAHLNVEVTVIPNGVVLREWQNDDVTTDTDKLSGNPKLITVGRVSDRKGQGDVVALLPELLKQFPELHYHCIGIAMESTPIIEEAKRLGVRDHVSFHGVLPEQMLKQFLKQSDIFMMLSKPGKNGDVEGFGIAILEANAMAVPAIGAFGSGVEDAICNEKSGLLVPLGNGQALGNAIGVILKNKQMYKHGAQKWAEGHDWDNIVKYYMLLLP